MTNLTIQMIDIDYKRLLKAAEQVNKSVQAFINEWISTLPEVDESFDVTQDPVFQMEGYESDAPSDLSINIDKYIYGENQ